MPRLADTLARLASILRRVIGAPDYERYVAHARVAHPGVAVMSYEEFVRDSMRRKYGKSASRCC